MQANWQNQDGGKKTIDFQAEIDTSDGTISLIPNHCQHEDNMAEGQKETFNSPEQAATGLRQILQEGIATS